ncbi:rop guanine nucleotide exchange factor 12-like [Apium graveolens]|uniref:rop guanine nucleotide exchange factor 12-like n=1 Tax=Apium graveolens TaxID=4045 RepID=UPI003D7B01F7
MKMVRATDIDDREASVRSRIFQFQGIRGGRQTQSMADIDIDDNGSISPGPPNKLTRSHASAPLEDEVQSALDSNQDILLPVSPDDDAPSSSNAKDMEAMKERFSKLLLGEDMSGGGKGVPSALALSNAITNLAASVFSEHKKLEPMPPEMKSRWRKEIDWLLAVTDQIVEFAPSKQSKNGITFEIMTTRQRTDLHMNIPALRKLDGMLIEVLENFKDQNEFSYMSKNSTDAQKSKNKRNEDKWWVPTPKVPPNGLSDVTRQWLQFQKDSVNQVHKAAMAINALILSEMEIPESYIESLPKNGKASLGDVIYKNITVEYFDPDYFLSSIDLSSEHKILDLKNRIEASIVIWRRKMTAKDGKSSWGSGVSLEKRELFEERLETILLILKHKFPGISQSSLDISKIEYNRDVGHAVLESYSRILESLAFTVMSRIEDVQHADETSLNPSVRSVERKGYSFRESPSIVIERFPNAKEEVEKINSEEVPTSMTLLDFMGWQMDQEEAEHNKKEAQDNTSNEKRKIPSIMPQKKFAYMDR